MKTCKFETLGCKVNQYDTQALRAALAGVGVREAGVGDSPDLILLNTCTVTGTGDRKSRYLIRRFGREHPHARLVVTGCYAQLDREEILGMPEVDACIGTQEQDRIPALIRQWLEDDLVTGGACTDIPARLESGRSPIREFSGRTRAYLKVQDGCNYKCSFCKVTIARGNARSRPLEELVREAAGLVEGGHREIVLVGIQLGYYGRDLEGHCDLTDLVDALEALPGLVRIRLSSIEPKDITPRLLDRMARGQKLCPHIHMPWQSGDDTVLARMRRTYRRKELMDIVWEATARVPGVAITTDIMVGFPGEGEPEFVQTLDLVSKLSPSRIHIFPYSDRSGTDAASFEGKVDPVEKKRRVARLKEAAVLEERRFQERLLGETVSVLVEGEGDGSYQSGYTGNYVKVRFSGRSRLDNRVARLKVAHVSDRGVFGNLLSIDTIG